MLTSFLGCTVVAALPTVSPGPDFAIVLRTALGSGRRAALCSALGTATGCFVWGPAGAAGLTAMLSASRVAYDALRIAGAAYLMWVRRRLEQVTGTVLFGLGAAVAVETAR
ncbi:LysE family translocator [Streptomyces niger]|uniref:LysE family translocator n=1 Tax=Streptomyces niger TaxID=66373 RepID=UPI000A918F97|nr:LysE family transporter [Streptomyces niger]